MTNRWSVMAIYWSSVCSDVNSFCVSRQSNVVGSKTSRMCHIQSWVSNLRVCEAGAPCFLRYSYDFGEEVFKHDLDQCPTHTLLFLMATHPLWQARWNPGGSFASRAILQRPAVGDPMTNGSEISNYFRENDGKRQMMSPKQHPTGGLCHLLRASPCVEFPLKVEHVT